MKISYKKVFECLNGHVKYLDDAIIKNARDRSAAGVVGTSFEQCFTDYNPKYSSITPSHVDSLHELREGLTITHYDAANIDEFDGFLWIDTLEKMVTVLTPWSHAACGGRHHAATMALTFQQYGLMQSEFLYALYHDLLAVVTLIVDYKKELWSVEDASKE